MGKKKLLVVVGAGASIEFGMPSVAEVGRMLNETAQTEFPLAHGVQDNIYAWTCNKIAQFWRLWTSTSINRVPNFEEMLSVIYQLRSVYPQGALSTPLAALVNPAQFPDVLGPFGPRAFAGNDWELLGHNLVNSLASSFRDKCISLATDGDAQIAPIRSFFCDSSKVFDVSVATLNYDDIVWKAMPGIATGFDNSGNFARGNLFNRAAWPCLLHLHGSVHFDIDDARGICWRDDLTQITHSDFFGGGSSYYINEGWTFPRTPLIAGYGKSMRLIGQPFRSYYAEFERLAEQSDALLCLGYGFGDHHINAILAGWRDDRRPIVIVDWAKDETMTAGSRSDDGNQTIGRALELFGPKPWEMTSLHGIVLNSVAEIKKQKSFEWSTGRPVAIWYNGMSEACKNPDLILAKLH